GGVNASSAAYAITAGAAVTTQSTIVVKGGSFVSGSDMTVVVTLKDAQGNPVPGQAELLDNGVAVPNATLKSKTSWTESDTEVGIYTATYVAVTASINQTATLRLGNSSVPSGTYAITPGAPARENSVIIVSGARYLLGGVLTVTVTLKDAAGNSVSGEEGKLATVVKVPNAELKEVWVDKGDGVYGATYTATMVGDNLKAIMTLNGWSQARESGVYRIVADGITGIQVNGYRFSADAGFPSTGFNGAKFILELKEGEASHYTWSSDAPWVSVNGNGEVSFTSKGNGQRVTLTGTAKDGGGAITYSFQLKHWFKAGAQWAKWEGISMTCKLPAWAQLTTYNLSSDREPKRVVGYLWGEWGGIDAYPGSNFSQSETWTSDIYQFDEANSQHGTYYPVTGRISTDNTFNNSGSYAVMCVEDF
ncbi:hypothetical protein ACTVM7_20095, partial [Serratia marcescens]